MRSLLIPVLVSAVLITGCGDDDEGESAGPVSAADWCATWVDLRAKEEPTEDELRAAAERAPDGLGRDVRALADAVAAGEGASSGPRLVPLFRSVAAVESWSHEHCGSEHPFCALWPSAALALASSALAGDDSQLSESDLQELVALALAHVPTEVADLRPAVEGTLDEAVTADQERAAEAAFDGLDRWVEERCDS